MKILVTCFDAFGGESVNPASLVVDKLPNDICGAEIIKLQIPTVFYKSIEIATKKIDEVKPDAVLCIGQAGGRSRISVERVAINVDDARIADNAGASPVDTAIDRVGESAHFATIPIKDMAKAIMAKSIPAEVSNTAGTFVCNHIMYGVLNHIHKNKMTAKAGFIHIPFLPQQVVDKPNMPSMALDVLVSGIHAALEVVAGCDTSKKIAEVGAHTH